MRKILFLLMIVFLLIGCEKKENKADLKEIFSHISINEVQGNETIFDGKM